MMRTSGKAEHATTPGRQQPGTQRQSPVKHDRRSKRALRRSRDGVANRARFPRFDAAIREARRDGWLDHLTANPMPVDPVPSGQNEALLKRVSGKRATTQHAIIASIVLGIPTAIIVALVSAAIFTTSSPEALSSTKDDYDAAFSAKYAIEPALSHPTFTPSSMIDIRSMDNQAIKRSSIEDSYFLKISNQGAFMTEHDVASLDHGSIKHQGVTPLDIYTLGLKNLDNRNYIEAEQILTRFLDENPDHSLAPNASYWLGETMYSRGRYDEAVAIFANNVDLYGIQSVKAMDNLLKLGLAWRALGKEAAACEAYARLADHFAEVPSYIRDALTRERDAARCNRESNDMTR